MANLRVMSLFGDDPGWVPSWHSFWNLKYLSSANLNSLNSPRNTYPECTNAGKNIFSMKINLVLLKPGSSGTSLPCQVFTAFQGAVVEPGKNFSSSTCSQWGLALLEQWLWLHSVEIEESAGTPSSAHQLSLVPRCPWCPHAVLGAWSQPWSAAAGTFGNPGQGELVLVLLEAEKTKAYQCHLGAERPLYCLISHAQLEFQFKGVFMNKINCILMRYMIQDGLEPKQFHLGHKSPAQVPWSSSVHSLLSELPAGWEEGKDSISEEPFPSYLLPFPCCRTSACSFAFAFHTSEEEQWWLSQEQPLQNQLLCRETLDQPPIFQICAKFSSFRSWWLAQRKRERSCCLWFQWCMTSVVGFFFPLYMLVAHKKSICGVDFTHNISISHFCEGLFSIGWFIMMWFLS